MATYYNLASFENCQVGDVIEYSANTAVDFTGVKKVNIILYGSSFVYKGYNATTAAHVKGGKADFNFLIPTNKNYYFSLNGGGSFCYGSSYDVYYRIAVGGDSGKLQISSQSSAIYYIPGAGGGLTGGKGGTSSYFGKGGTQAAGGNGGSKGSYDTGYKGTAGSFGVGGYTVPSSGTSGGQGGNGWYGGGSGSYIGGDGWYGGGGGSGFIIGQSTAVYPSGYMGDDSNLITELEGCISSAVLTQGAAPNATEPSGQSASHRAASNTETMILTILELEPTSHPAVKYYNGSNFIECEVYQAVDVGAGLVSFNSDFTEGQQFSTDVGEFDIGSVDVDWYLDYSSLSSGEYESTDLIITPPSSFKAGILYIIPISETYDSRDISIRFGSNQVSLTHANAGSSLYPEKVQNFFQAHQEYTECYYFTPTSDLSSLTVWVGVDFDDDEYDSEATVTIRKDIYYYDEDLQFIQVQPYYYNGTEFVELGI